MLFKTSHLVSEFSDAAVMNSVLAVTVHAEQQGRVAVADATDDICSARGCTDQAPSISSLEELAEIGSKSW